MPGEDEVFGFSSADADELINMIGGTDQPYREGRANPASTAIFGYTLTSSSVGNIYRLVAGSFSGTALATGKTLYDPLGMFGDQVTGDSGYCFRVGGYYYRLQAPCKT